MKNKLIQAFADLKSAIWNISNKNWVKGHGYHLELKLDRIKQVLIVRYKHDPEELEFHKRGPLDLQHETEVDRIVRTTKERLCNN